VPDRLGRPPPAWPGRPPPAPGGPLLVCLNRSWGGPSLWERALLESADAGRPVTFVYVIAAPSRRTGGAGRAVRAARRVAAAHGIVAGETVVRAPDVADGLRMAQAALGGRVCVPLREDRHREELALRHIPLLPLHR
jgi:hypothetical protein